MRCGEWSRGVLGRGCQQGLGLWVLWGGGKWVVPVARDDGEEELGTCGGELAKIERSWFHKEWV